MSRIRLVAPLLMAAGVTLIMLGGCVASHQARDVEIKGTLLVNSDILEKGAEDEALYRYRNPKADLKKYTKVLIEPVIVIKSAELDPADLENYQKLSNNAYVYLVQELEKDYQVVQTSEPGTLRIQMAIIDADTSKPVRNFLSTFIPVGMAVSAMKYGVTGKASAVGEISGEFRVADANTGELLGAAVDRRVGGKELKGIWDTWYNADDALKFWARGASYALCKSRGGSSCIKP